MIDRTHCLSVTKQAGIRTFTESVTRQRTTYKALAANHSGHGGQKIASGIRLDEIASTSPQSFLCDIGRKIVAAKQNRHMRQLLPDLPRSFDPMDFG